MAESTRDEVDTINDIIRGLHLRSSTPPPKTPSLPYSGRVPAEGCYDLIQEIMASLQLRTATYTVRVGASDVKARPYGQVKYRSINQVPITTQGALYIFFALESGDPIPLYIGESGEANHSLTSGHQFFQKFRETILFTSKLQLVLKVSEVAPSEVHKELKLIFLRHFDFIFNKIHNDQFRYSDINDKEPFFNHALDDDALKEKKSDEASEQSLISSLHSF